MSRSLFIRFCTHLNQNDQNDRWAYLLILIELINVLWIKWQMLQSLRGFGVSLHVKQQSVSLPCSPFIRYSILWQIIYKILNKKTVSLLIYVTYHWQVTHGVFVQNINASQRIKISDYVKLRFSNQILIGFVVYIHLTHKSVQRKEHWCLSFVFRNIFRQDHSRLTLNITYDLIIVCKFSVIKNIIKILY